MAPKESVGCVAADPSGAEFARAGIEKLGFLIGPDVSGGIAVCCVVLAEWELLSRKGRSSGFAGTRLQPPAKRYKGDQEQMEGPAAYHGGRDGGRCREDGRVPDEAREGRGRRSGFLVAAAEVGSNK
ncbi:hypothetical protein B296_00014861 [Ensete ventricosum]|uniref:Uncharacterized protein n=1 Tax=Ensete ventricosum TaxID=4639 RepID=A0A426YMQ7_ENSVE|nr:hypothetical protein B296_00014861 [Ensete ventricosum]